MGVARVKDLGEIYKLVLRETLETNQDISKILKLSTFALRFNINIWRTWHAW